MANTATRLITLIMLLQRQPGRTASQLADELEVSVRTVQRYMTMLEDIGIPVYAERGPYGGYALVRGYRMPPLIFTPEEAAALYLGASFLQEVWGQLYQEGARGALAKLDNVLPDEQHHYIAWARQHVLSLGMNWADPTLWAPYLEQLHGALFNRHCIRMRYRSRGQEEPTERDIDPYKLVSRWGRQYVVGYCHQRQAVRSFALERIATLEVLDETFAEPCDFDWEAYLAADPFFHPRVRARLRFGPDATTVALNNRAHWDHVEEQPDGSVIVTFYAPDLEAAAGAVVQGGYPATILEPDELYAAVRAQVRVLAEHFDKEM